MGSAREKFVQQAIINYRVIIFSKTTCPRCREIKQDFKKSRTPFHAIELDKRKDAHEIQQMLLKLTGGKTVPRVFIHGKYAGNGDDIRRMFRNRNFRKLLGELKVS